MTQTNPLIKHYRQPALYIKLPSGGQYWEDGTLELPASGEIPVFPMTTKDEIALKTPDALLNGEGVVSVIQSCCPNIKDAWKMPAVDTDYVLIAIRIASYGKDLKFDSTCPSCNETSSYEQDLREVVDSIQGPDFSRTFKVNGLTIKFKPQRYVETNTINQINFEEQRMLMMLEDPAVTDEVKRVRLKENLTKMLELGLKSLTSTTESISTEEGDAVTDPQQIYEFYQNVDAKTIKSIKEEFDKITESVNLRPFQIKCTNCGHEYKSSFEFDYTNFFV